MRIILAKPRGFCAGVDRAIRSVEKALSLFGPPVYVLKHIVHNAHVVEALKDKGAVFVQDLDAVPPRAPLLFSAHGVSPERWEQARAQQLHIIDATCPLVEKVHQEIRRFAAKGYTIIYIGDAGHDETVGAVGWAPDSIRLVGRVEDVAQVEVADATRVAYITQTTLSLADCEVIVAALRERFPAITAPHKPDICYATSNRQRAVISLAPEADAVIVVGDPESANSRRLRDIAVKLGKPAQLIPDAQAVDYTWLENTSTLLLTSGASVPEHLVAVVISEIQRRRKCTVEERVLAHEHVHFQLPI